jgi:hypothetical protein
MYKLTFPISVLHGHFLYCISSLRLRISYCWSLFLRIPRPGARFPPFAATERFCRQAGVTLVPNLFVQLRSTTSSSASEELHFNLFPPQRVFTAQILRPAYPVERRIQQTSWIIPYHILSLSRASLSVIYGQPFQPSLP